MIAAPMTLSAKANAPWVPQNLPINPWTKMAGKTFAC